MSQRLRLVQMNADFRDKAPVSGPPGRGDHPGRGAGQGMAHPHRRGRQMIDSAVRAKPEAAYDYAELFGGLKGQGR